MRHLNKYLAILFVVLFATNIAAQNGLNIIHSPGYGYMEFVSDSEGWLVNEDHIKKTFDEGKTWEIKITLDKIKYHTAHIKNGVDFVSASIGYFLIFTKVTSGYPKYFLYKTIDGGNSWEQREIKIGDLPTSDITHLTFLNEYYGWARYNYNKLIRTTNGGLTWELLGEDLGNVYKIKFVNESVGYYYTTSGLFKTIDGGFSWSQLNTDLTYHWDFDVVGSEIWIGSDGVYYSSNAGENFAKICPDLYFGNNSYIKMIDANHGVADGYYTSDGGKNWVNKSVSKPASFFDYNNGWYFENGDLKKATDNFNSTTIVFPALDFSDVVIVTDLVIIASAFNGAIIRSNDGGKTWTFINDLYGTHIIYDLCFGDAGNGIAVGYYQIPNDAHQMGFIAHTSDIGISWQIVMDNTGEVFGGNIYSADFSNGKYFVKSIGRMLRSENGGLNWSIDSTDYSGAAFMQTDFIGNTGFGIAYYGIRPLVKTTNGGIGWNTSLTQATSVSFVADNLLWASSGGKIFKSYDAGSNWIDSELNFHDIYFKDQLLGVAWGPLDAANYLSDGTYITQDGGISWQKIFNERIGGGQRAIDFTSEAKGFIATQKSLYTTLNFGNVDSIVSVEQNDLNKLPTDFSLLQNYPNPFNHTTNIKYTLPDQSRVRISVFNIIGEKIHQLIDIDVPAGIHQFQYNANNLSSGVYYLKMDAIAINNKAEFSGVKKIILLK